MTKYSKLLTLRRALMRLWKYNRPGSRRRELLRELVAQIDGKLNAKGAEVRR
jgi:hypothetical protein